MRIISRIVIVTAASCVLSLPTAFAGDLPNNPILTTSGSAAAGAAATITLTATGFCTGDTVSFFIGGTAALPGPEVGRTAADVNGTASVTVVYTAPANTTASVVAVATSNGICTIRQSAPIALLASQAPVPTTVPTTVPGAGAGSAAKPQLPTSGSDAVRPLQVGSVLLAAGLGLVGVSVFRRRQRRTAAA